MTGNDGRTTAGDIRRALALVDARHHSVVAACFLGIAGIGLEIHAHGSTASTTETWIGWCCMLSAAVAGAIAVTASRRLDALLEDRPSLAPAVAAAEGDTA